MVHISTGVEYALHCLLFLAANPDADMPPSVRELADMQGVPAEFAAKVFTKLQKAGLTETDQGVRGGVRFARDPHAISVLDVVKAVDGERQLFECREIRGKCALFEHRPPEWATSGLCGIHAIMRSAQERMNEALAEYSVGAIAAGFLGKAPEGFGNAISQWFEVRALARTDGTRKTGRSEGQ